MTTCKIHENGFTGHAAGLQRASAGAGTIPQGVSETLSEMS
jgi:hypothetical protein